MQDKSAVTGQVFHPSEGRIIGKQDASGNVVLVVDPATLAPQIYGALCRLGISDTKPETTQESKRGSALCSLHQNPTAQER